jgi:hypothetical protein
MVPSSNQCGQVVMTLSTQQALHHWALLLAGLLALPAHGGGAPAVLLDPVVVEGSSGLDEAPASASEGLVTGVQLEQRPISRVAELLEFAPGLIATQHSGEGKANQYFLRGFNLDHGTDFYTEVDGLPVNMRSHGHGQGYAEFNFIIPELIGSLEYRKGPYYAAVGDFGSAGSASLRYVDRLPAPLLRLSLGEFGHRNALLAGSPTVVGGNLLLAGEIGQYQGPFDLNQDVTTHKGLARYNRGDEREGFTTSLAAYNIEYLAPDQIPQRAVERGLIGPLGFIDPTVGGEVQRLSLNAEWRGLAADGYWRAQAYALSYNLQLYSNFTYFLEDPADTDPRPSDQFEQFDERKVYGLNTLRYWRLTLAMPIDLEAGLQVRYDDIDTVGLYLTRARERDETVREDVVRQGSVGLYLNSTQRWTSSLRTVTGLRYDYFDFDVVSDLAANSGQETDYLVSPKLAVILGPWARTEFYLNYGLGFHSNDARGTTLRLDPTDPARVTEADPVQGLVRQRGGEFGINSRAIDNLALSASFWALGSDSELVYVGDAGNSEVGPPSRRRGMELSAYYTPLDWLILDVDYAVSRARLDVPAGEGNRIPNSVENVFSLGLTVPETARWSAGLRLRYLGGGPLIEDNSARSSSTIVVNTQLGYRLLRNTTVSLAVLNLFDSKDNDITYFYQSRLPGEPTEGVEDFHFHRVEPRAVRLRLRAEF